MPNILDQLRRGDPYFGDWELWVKGFSPFTNAFTHPEARSSGPPALAASWLSHPHVGFGEAIGTPQAFWPGDHVYAYSQQAETLLPGKVEPPRVPSLVAVRLDDPGHLRHYRPELVAHRDRVTDRTPKEHRRAADQEDLPPHVRAAHLAAADFVSQLEEPSVSPSPQTT